MKFTLRKNPAVFTSRLSISENSMTKLQQIYGSNITKLYKEPIRSINQVFAGMKSIVAIGGIDTNNVIRDVIPTPNAFCNAFPGTTEDTIANAAYLLYKQELIPSAMIRISNILQAPEVVPKSLLGFQHYYNERKKYTEWFHSFPEGYYFPIKHIAMLTFSENEFLQHFVTYADNSAKGIPYKSRKVRVVK